MTDKQLPAEVKLQQTFEKLREIATGDMPHAIAVIGAELASIAASMQPLGYVWFDLDLAAGHIHLHCHRHTEKAEKV